VVANNPSILAVSKAMAHYSHVTPRRIALLSIGAGHYPRFANLTPEKAPRERPLMIEGQAMDTMPLRVDWGIRQWIPYLLGETRLFLVCAGCDCCLLILDLILDGDSITTEMVMYYLLAGTNMYHRIDPK